MSSFEILLENGEPTIDDYDQIAKKLFSGSLNDSQLVDIFRLLNTKKVENQIQPFAKIMRKNSISLHTNLDGLVDTCGTGGDGRNTFNISTAAAIIGCSAGVKIAKHGNRAASGKSGSADVIEELGIKIQEPEGVKTTLEKTGFGFLFAQYFHPKLKKIAHVRRQLGFKTVFNLLGPLCNPAGAKRQIVGVYDEKLLLPFANALVDLGCDRGLIVNSEGMDEIGLGKTKLAEIRNGKMETYEIEGNDFGFRDDKIPTVKNAKESAQIIMRVLEGKERAAAREIVLINAAAAIYVSGLVNTIEDGIERSTEAIDSGKALKKLDEIKTISFIS